MKKPLIDLDYVNYFAQRLRDNPSLFKDNKLLIDSQIKSSKEIFLKRFGKKNFKENARKYLREIGILTSK